MQIDTTALYQRVNNLFDRLYAAQSRIDSITERYARPRELLNAEFLAERIDYDEYMQRSTRLRMRIHRELSLVAL